jgi:hypothetical protein
MVSNSKETINNPAMAAPINIKDPAFSEARESPLGGQLDRTPITTYYTAAFD